jgi:hypothetical protein
MIDCVGIYSVPPSKRLGLGSEKKKEEPHIAIN